MIVCGFYKDIKSVKYQLEFRDTYLLSVCILKSILHANIFMVQFSKAYNKIAILKKKGYSRSYRN